LKSALQQGRATIASAFFDDKRLQNAAEICYTYTAKHSKERRDDNMTFAKICMAVLVCIPLTVVIYFCLKKLVDEIR